MTQHSETRVLQHSPEQLYQLVADVKRYPEFLPWCLAARIREQNDEKMIADLIIGFQMFKERFTSYVRLDDDAMEIHVEYAEGPLNICKIIGSSSRIQRGAKLNFMSILNLTHASYRQ